MKVHIVTYCKWMNFVFCSIVVGMKIFDLALLKALKSKSLESMKLNCNFLIYFY